ncbi:MAG: hypothetical protein K5769_08290, partial [Pseudobutyrivibrio sp.]|nr:hypothetical protein [Pseudobutyrivibrio sp.]
KVIFEYIVTNAHSASCLSVHFQPPSWRLMTIYFQKSLLISLSALQCAAIATKLVLWNYFF